MQTIAHLAFCIVGVTFHLARLRLRQQPLRGAVTIFGRRHTHEGAADGAAGFGKIVADRCSVAEQLEGGLETVRGHLEGENLR